MKISDILKLDLPGLKIAYEIAQEAHKDQKRWGGEPYMIHIDAVIEGVYNQQFALVTQFRKDTLKVIDAYLIVAALHDVIEDQADKFSIQDIENKLGDILKQHIYKTVIQSILAITKQDGEEYVEYLKRVKKMPISLTVKKSDLLHNMSDLSKHKKKDKLDKYKLAYAVLNDEF